MNTHRETNMYDKRRLKRSQRGGFSYLELMVTITVFSLMSVSFLANYNKINGKIALDTEAEKIGQAIREAQIFALSAKGVVDSGIIKFPRYGIYFKDTVPDSYVLFSDYNNNGKYDAGGGCGAVNTECINKTTLKKRTSITALCGKPLVVQGTQGSCPATNVGSDNFEILFVAPNTDATISGKTTPGGPVGFSSASITIKSSASAYSRTITLYRTSQIAIK